MAKKKTCSVCGRTCRGELNKQMALCHEHLAVGAYVGRSGSGHSPVAGGPPVGVLRQELPQTQRERRGHDFFPPGAEEIPGLYETDGDGPLSERTIHAHYFVGGADWYVAELDPDTGMAWGYALLDARHPENAEWGLMSLRELEELKVDAGFFDLVVERDCYWDPVPAKDADLPGHPFPGE